MYFLTIVIVLLPLLHCNYARANSDQDLAIGKIAIERKRNQQKAKEFIQKKKQSACDIEGVISKYKRAHTAINNAIIKLENNVRYNNSKFQYDDILTKLVNANNDFINSADHCIYGKKMKSAGPNQGIYNLTDAFGDIMGFVEKFNKTVSHSKSKQELERIKLQKAILMNEIRSLKVPSFAELKAKLTLPRNGK